MEKSRDWPRNILKLWQYQLCCHGQSLEVNTGDTELNFLTSGHNLEVNTTWPKCCGIPHDFESKHGWSCKNTNQKLCLSHFVLWLVTEHLQDDLLSIFKFFLILAIWNHVFFTTEAERHIYCWALNGGKQKIAV